MRKLILAPLAILLVSPVSMAPAEDLAGSRQFLCAAAQATAEQQQNFKKAFSVCLEAKNYMVKY